MKAVLLAVAAAGVLSAGAVQAQEGADFLKAKGCLGCHDFDKKKVGPAFKDLAAKYKGDSGAVGKVVAKMLEGKGHPKVKQPEADLQKAVGHALAAH